MTDKREVYIKNENRSDGNYSIYVCSAYSNMSWYTGMTFGSLKTAQSMVAKIEKDWAKL